MTAPVGLPAPERLRHGTRSRYVVGCRCAECRAANAAACRERQRLAKEAAAEIVAPDAPVEQLWTGPDGQRRTRVYRRACPGVEGAPCPTRSHLRKDSKGGVCGGCRVLLVWNGLVDAAPVRKHLRRLSRAGVGYKSVAIAADVGRTTLAGILSGKKTRIRKRAAQRVLAVTAEAVADHALVDAAATWRLIEKLLARGFTSAELARRLGMKTPAIQIGKRQVLARTALAVERLYRSAGTPPPRGHCTCKRPLLFERQGVEMCGRCELATRPAARVAVSAAAE